MDDLERRKGRLQGAHMLIRAELGIAFAFPFVAAFVYLAMPRGPSPMFAGEPPLVETFAEIGRASCRERVCSTV